MAAGMDSQVTWPQPGQVRAWPWNSVTTALTLGSSANWCQTGSGSAGEGCCGSGAWQASHWLGTRAMTCCTREAGRRRRWWPLWPGWPPVLRPVGFLTTGGGAAGGLAEGAREELEALSPRRCLRSRPSRSRSSTSCSSVAMRASRWAHPGQLGWLIPSFYRNRCRTGDQSRQKRWAVTKNSAQITAPVYSQAMLHVQVEMISSTNLNRVPAETDLVITAL